MIRPLLLALTLAACGGGGVALGDLGDELVDAYCARAVRCGVYASAAACKADLTVNLEEAVRSVEAGRTSYSEDKAGECLDAMRDASCDATSEGARADSQICEDVFEGNVADGGACFGSEDCVSGTCETPDCGMACCQGTCVATMPVPGIGQACPAGECVVGAFCNDSAMCVALLAAGAACADNDQCGYGLYCPQVEVGTRVCVDAPNRGEACPAGDCADIGDRCSSTSMTCVALAQRGEACAQGFAGLFDCQRPLVCNQTSLTCTDPPAVGQACDFFCVEGAFCNDSNVCEAVKANGATCGGDSECSSRFCDDTLTTPVCADEPICG